LKEDKMNVDTMEPVLLRAHPGQVLGDDALVLAAQAAMRVRLPSFGFAIPA
jgi:hypothetical protein